MQTLKERYSLLLFIVVLLLSCIGIIFVFSAGTYWSAAHYEGQTSFYIKQAMYLVIGFFGYVLISQLVIIRNERFWFMFYLFSLFLLIAVLIPGIGLERNGSRSWIGIGGLTFQPAEFAKITSIVYLSFLLGKQKTTERIVQFRHFGVLLLPVILIMLQPDFGSVFILIVAIFILLFIAGYPWKFYAGLILLGTGGIVGLILSAPYRLKRIQAFLNPWEDPLGSGFQAVQSLMAIGPAGLFGHGFGQSRQKFLYLPEPQNDFIFAIILEEIGLIGGLVIVSLFVFFIYIGIAMAIRATSRTYFFASITLILMIGFQAFLNMGVVIGLLPVTGVTLPFISYGGTSLVMAWLTIGLVQNFSKL